MTLEDELEGLDRSQHAGTAYIMDLMGGSSGLVGHAARPASGEVPVGSPVPRAQASEGMKAQ